jgi:UDP-3-O-acyl N-acetylglucosamine deacetylase
LVIGGDTTPRRRPMLVRKRDRKRMRKPSATDATAALGASLAMPVARRQRTIARPASAAGFGYYSGRDVRVEFWPAAEEEGITFVRHDLGPSARVPATVACRVEAPRRTSLERDGVRVDMVEHVLAALAGLGVDNCEVWVDAQEMPGCDGSARAFVEAIDSAGIIEQRRPVRQVVIQQSLRIGGGDSWIAAEPPRTAGLSVSFELDFGPTSAIGRQLCSFDVAPHTFRRELSCCRTFIAEDVAQGMRAQGIGQRVTPRDLLIFGPRGPIDNELRFPDECVRHKVLDVVGDLALVGCEVIGHIVAFRSGHQLHAEMAKRLTELAEQSAEPGEIMRLRKCA